MLTSMPEYIFNLISKMTNTLLTPDNCSALQVGVRTMYPV